MEHLERNETATRRVGKELESFKNEYAEFIDLAAHDLDAPLRKLSVLVEKLAGNEKEISADKQAYLQRINSCLSDMRSLVDNLALLSRAGIAPLNIKEFNPELIAREVCNELRPSPEAKLTYDGIKTMCADPSQFRQLFKIILQNAIIFSKKNIAPHVHIHAEIIPTEMGRSMGIQSDTGPVKVSVSDKGIGFKQENAKKIFQPFVRLHGKSDYAGTGIGLAIGKRIVENHGGLIYAEGTLDSGASIIFIIPQTTN